MLILIVLTLAKFSFCAVWAVLLNGIGDYGMSGYSGATDVYQAYYQFTELGGIPKENIIVFDMDVVAENSRNPFKGEVYSYPGGPEIYKYIKDNLDYVNKDNTPDVFFKVLKGEDPGCGSRRVLNSTEEDTGSSGTFYFIYPRGFDKTIHTRDLTTAFKGVKSKHLISYFTTCYAGSMFEGQYDSDGPISVITAAPPHASAMDCCPNATLHTDTTCSCFNSKWAMDSRKLVREKKMETTSMNDQYDTLLKLRENDENYCLYGNLDLAKKVFVSEYQTAGSNTASNEEEAGLSYNLKDSDWCPPPDSTHNAHRGYHTRTPKRDALDARIWGLFRSRMHLEEIDVDENDYTCSHHSITCDLDVHKRIVASAFEKCDIYANYNPKNSLYLTQLCNMEVDEKEIVDAMHDICVETLNVPKTYDIIV